MFVSSSSSDIVGSSSIVRSSSSDIVGLGPLSLSAGKTSQQLATESAPLGYRMKTRKERLAQLEKGVSRQEVYYPDCAVSGIGKNIMHNLNNFFVGSFLDIKDGHMKKGGFETTAILRATCNVLGKTIYGIGLAAAVILPIALGITAAVLGTSLLGLEPNSAAYLGAIIGGVAGVVITGAICLLGSSMIAMTETEGDAGERALTVVKGTAQGIYIALHVLVLVVSIGKASSEFEYLKAGDIKGFLFLHTLGIPL